MFTRKTIEKLALLSVLAQIVLFNASCQDMKVERSSNKSTIKRKPYIEKSVLHESVISTASLEKAVSLYISDKILPDKLTVHQLIEAIKKAIDKDDYEASYSLSAKLLELEPANGYGNYARGISEYNSIGGNIEKSLQFLTRSVKLSPKESYSSSAFEYLARIYFDQKEIKKAIAMINRAIELDPTSELKFGYRAIMYRELGDDKKAEKDYDKAIENNRTGTKMYFNRAKFYESQKRYDEALRDYDTIIKNVLSKKRKNFDRMGLAQKYKAFIYIKLGKSESAIKAISKNIEINPSGTDGYTMRGGLYLEREDYQKAIDDFTKAIELNPKYERNAYEGRAKAYHALNMPDKAADDEKMTRKIKRAPAEKPLYEINREKER